MRYETTPIDSRSAENIHTLIYRLELQAPTENLDGILSNVYKQIQQLAMKDLITDDTFAHLTDRIMRKRVAIQNTLRAA